MLTKWAIIVAYDLLAQLGVLGTQGGVPDKSHQGAVPPSGVSSIFMAFSWRHA